MSPTSTSSRRVPHRERMLTRVFLICPPFSGDIFLHRDGELALAFVREVEDLKLSKLVRSNASASSSIIREQDINLALLRASVGTSSSTDPALEQLRFVLEKGPLRPFLPPVASTSSLSASTTLRPSPVSLPPTSAALKLFSSHLLGTPLTLTSTLSWPLDLFLTPPALLAYSSIFAYLTALRRTHTRVLGCWLSLSGAQRTRMKWTGVGEGGEEGRKKVARLGWGVVRLMVWFLDSIMSHFQVRLVSHSPSRDTFDLFLCCILRTDRRNRRPAPRSPRQTSERVDIKHALGFHLQPQRHRRLNHPSYTPWAPRRISTCLLARPFTLDLRPSLPDSHARVDHPASTSLPRLYILSPPVPSLPDLILRLASTRTFYHPLLRVPNGASLPSPSSLAHVRQLPDPRPRLPHPPQPPLQLPRRPPGGSAPQ